MRLAAAVLLTAWLGLAQAQAQTQAAAPGPGEWTFDAGDLGPVAVYAPGGPPTRVVLFVSGDAGWSHGVVDMARQLQGWGALVAGVDVRHCLGTTVAPAPACARPAATFERLARAVEKRAGLATYQPPILIGYSSGANLVYGLARDAPAGTFAAAISLGFCAAPQAGTVPAPTPRLRVPWVALHGALDTVCLPGATRAFVAAVPSGKFVLLPKVGHAFAVEANWLPQFRDAYLKLVTATTEAPLTAGAVADLPLVEMPGQAGTRPALPDTFVVLLTGDGGWAGLDREVAGALAGEGMPVVAWSTLRYFWAERTPELAGRDLGRIIRYYAVLWHRPRVLLVGYSFGANVLPFLAGHLPPAARQSVRGIGLLAPATHTGFEVRVADWIPGSVPQGQPILPALRALDGLPLLCIYSEEDADSLCPLLPKARARSLRLPGGHHFDGDSATLAREILGFTGH